MDNNYSFAGKTFDYAFTRMSREEQERVSNVFGGDDPRRTFIDTLFLISKPLTRPPRLLIWEKELLYPTVASLHNSVDPPLLLLPPPPPPPPPPMALESFPREILVEIIGKLSSPDDLLSMVQVSKRIRQCAVEFGRLHGSKTVKLLVGGGLINIPAFLRTKDLACVSHDGVAQEYHNILATLISRGNGFLCTTVVIGKTTVDGKCVFICTTFSMIASKDRSYPPSGAYNQGSDALREYLARRVKEAKLVQTEVDYVDTMSISFRTQDDKFLFAMGLDYTCIDPMLENRKDLYCFHASFVAHVDGKAISCVLETAYQFTMLEVINPGTWWSLLDKKWLEENIKLYTIKTRRSC